MSKENMHYSCIACITIDHPEVYLEEYKYRTKKTKIPNFIKNELKWDSESGSDSDDKKLMAKLMITIMIQIQKFSQNLMLKELHSE